MNPYELALKYIGLREKPGGAIDPFVAFINRLAGGGETEDAWCGSFVHFIAFNLGLEVPSEPRRARAWLRVGEWRSSGSAMVSPYLERSDRPARAGDVVILSRGPLPQPGPEVFEAPGHVGFLAPRFTMLGGDELALISGNMSDAVTLQSFPISRVLGVRRLRPAGEVR